MGKRSRTQDFDPADLSVAERVAQAEKEYRSLRRTMTIGLVAVVLLIAGLIIQQPGGWEIAVVLLGAIEGVSYFFLMRSLERRKDERIARIQAGEDL